MAFDPATMDELPNGPHLLVGRLLVRLVVLSVALVPLACDEEVSGNDDDDDGEVVGDPTGCSASEDDDDADDDDDGQCGGDPGGSGGTCTDPLAELNDTFDADLAGWDIHHPEDANVSVAGGSLVLEPYANTQWFNADEALHVHKTVVGNFAVSGLITVTDLAGGPAAPGGPYRIGGLMVRNPQGPAVDSVHMGIGNMNTPGVVTLSKNTNDSISQIGTTDWTGGTTAEMKICRVGFEVRALIRTPGDPWTIIDSHLRPDLPAAVVAGPIAYAGTAAPDLRVTVDYVRYETVDSVQDCLSEYDPAC